VARDPIRDALAAHDQEEMKQFALGGKQPAFRSSQQFVRKPRNARKSKHFKPNTRVSLVSIPILSCLIVRFTKPFHGLLKPKFLSEFVRNRRVEVFRTRCTRAHESRARVAVESI